MQKGTKYALFDTKWGYFGLAGTESGLYRTYLPGSKPAVLKSQLLKDFPEASIEPTFCQALQKQIVAYFEGARVDFSPNVPLVLDGVGDFSRCVLAACRNVQFGQVITYRELAKRSGRPAASRAVGGALARNPLALLIPCHRIIRTDGKLGGFSAPGGIELKQRMLDLERFSICSVHGRPDVPDLQIGDRQS
jgi:methylated-DNA-[protein]-cysteine S-methyltransferase